MVYCYHSQFYIHVNFYQTDLNRILERKDMDVNEHDRLSKSTPRHKVK
jgi:hypothetical protein